MGSQFFDLATRGACIYRFPSTVRIAVLFGFDYDKSLRSQASEWIKENRRNPPILRRIARCPHNPVATADCKEINSVFSLLIIVLINILLAPKQIAMRRIGPPYPVTLLHSELRLRWQDRHRSGHALRHQEGRAGQGRHGLQEVGSDSVQGG